MKKALYIVFFTFLVPLCALADAWDGTIVEYEPLQNKDTIVVTRRFSQWWFGAYGGWQAKRYFGKLVAPENSLYGVNPFSKLITIKEGFGSGLTGGLSFDYVDSADQWTYGLKLGVLDRVAWSGSTPVSRDTFQTQFENQTIFDCLTLSPNVRYRLWSSDFFLTGGLDFEINTNVIAKNRKKFVNTGYIDQFNRITLNGEPVRYGVSLGLAYDFFVADINKNARAVLSPFTNVQFGSSHITERGSSWNSIAFKVGLTIKFGFDRKQYDTLFFDPNAVRPGPAYNALAQADLRIAYPGYFPPRHIETMELAVVAYSKINEEISIKSNTNGDTSNVAAIVDNRFTNESTQRPKPVAKPKFNPPTGAPKRLDGFQSPSDVILTPAHKKYLDELAEFMKANPNYEVRLNAFSDDRGGSIPKNLENSRKRGEAVRNYLIKRNVPENRILLSPRGSFPTVAFNTTEEGRRANRRVEITIVKLKQTN